MKQIIEYIRKVMQGYRTRQELEQLSDRDLMDIGLSRKDIRYRSWH